MKLIQSYLLETYFVSTVYRESSAAIIPAIWYHETIVWEWDAETKQRGKMLETHDSGMEKKIALQNHFRICLELMNKLSEEK